MLSFRRTLAVALALATWSCGSTQPSDSTPQVAAIVVNPASSTLALNAQLPLQALVQNEAGELVPDASVTWTVENPTVASVSPAGVVTALALGTTQVAANARGKSGLATVTVQRTPVASVVVVPNRVSTGIGSTTELKAKAYDAAQTELPDRGMVWTTSNASVATVDGVGLVTTKGKGTATITATAEGKSGTSEFTVSPGAVSKVTITPSSLSMLTGDRQQLSASAQDASGTLLSGMTVVWASDRSTVATVNGGQVTAVSAGSATITATVDGVVGSAGVTVATVPAASVTVAPSTLALTIAQTGTLVATVRDANGNVLAGRAVTWTTNNPLVATVTQAGVVTGLLPGTATITATSGSASGTAAVTVSPIPVGSVAVSPSSRSIVQNASTTLAATVKDANGNTLNGQTITWTTSDARHREPLGHERAECRRRRRCLGHGDDHGDERRKVGDVDDHRDERLGCERHRHRAEHDDQEEHEHDGFGDGPGRGRQAAPGAHGRLERSRKRPRDGLALEQRDVDRGEQRGDDDRDGEVDLDHRHGENHRDGRGQVWFGDDHRDSMTRSARGVPRSARDAPVRAARTGAGSTAQSRPPQSPPAQSPTPQGRPVQGRPPLKRGLPVVAARPACAPVAAARAGTPVQRAAGA